MALNRQSPNILPQQPAIYPQLPEQMYAGTQETIRKKKTRTKRSRSSHKNRGSEMQKENINPDEFTVQRRGSLANVHHPQSSRVETSATQQEQVTNNSLLQIQNQTYV